MSSSASPASKRIKRNDNLIVRAANVTSTSTNTTDVQSSNAKGSKTVAPSTNSSDKEAANNQRPKPKRGRPRTKAPGPTHGASDNQYEIARFHRPAGTGVVACCYCKQNVHVLRLQSHLEHHVSTLQQATGLPLCLGRRTGQFGWNSHAGKGFLCTSQCTVEKHAGIDGSNGQDTIRKRRQKSSSWSSQFFRNQPVEPGLVFKAALVDEASQAFAHNLRFEVASAGTATTTAATVTTTTTTDGAGTSNARGDNITQSAPASSIMTAPLQLPFFQKAPPPPAQWHMLLCRCGRPATFVCNVCKLHAVCSQACWQTSLQSHSAICQTLAASTGLVRFNPAASHLLSYLRQAHERAKALTASRDQLKAQVNAIAQQIVSTTHVTRQAEPESDESGLYTPTISPIKPSKPATHSTLPRVNQGQVQALQPKRLVAMNADTTKSSQQKTNARGSDHDNGLDRTVAAPPPVPPPPILNPATVRPSLAVLCQLSDISSDDEGH